MHLEFTPPDLAGLDYSDSEQDQDPKRQGQDTQSQELNAFSGLELLALQLILLGQGFIFFLLQFHTELRQPLRIARVIFIFLDAFGGFHIGLKSRQRRHRAIGFLQGVGTELKDLHLHAGQIGWATFFGGLQTLQGRVIGLGRQLSFGSHDPGFCFPIAHLFVEGPDGFERILNRLLQLTLTLRNRAQANQRGPIV